MSLFFVSSKSCYPVLLSGSSVAASEEAEPDMDVEVLGDVQDMVNEWDDDKCAARVGMLPV